LHFKSGGWGAAKKKTSVKGGVVARGGGWVLPTGKKKPKKARRLTKNLQGKDA